jgi:site-specific DNA recombinase
MMRAGVQVISTTQPLGDSMDPNNFLLELLNVGMGQHMVLDIRKKSIDGKTAAAKHATFQGGYPPLGYDVVDRKYVVNEREAKIVRMIFDMYANGKSYKDILEALKNERTKRGAAFSANSFKNLLRNERYIGVYTWNKEIERVFRKWVGRKPNPNMVRIENAIPAIIDKNTWNKVQERLSDKTRNACNKARHDYLLSGLIVCADCGNRYVGYTSTNTKGYSTRYYSCGRKYRTRDCMPKNINANFIENFVIESVKNFLRTTDFEEFARAIIEDYNSSCKIDLSEERSELNKINRELQNGVKSVLSGLDFPELRAEIERLQSRKSELESIIEKKTIKTPTPTAIPIERTHFKSTNASAAIIKIDGSANVIKVPRAKAKIMTINKFCCLDKEEPIYSPTFVRPISAPIWSKARPTVKQIPPTPNAK